MADTFQALADLVKVNDANNSPIEVTDLTQRAPLLAALAAEPSSNGTSHKYLKETGAPTVGFRAVNAGREFSKSTDTQVTIDLKILDASFRVDKALADAYMGGPSAFVGREALRHLRAAFSLAERQVVNGDAAAGFDGLIDALATTGNPMVTLAAASGDSLTSIWLVRTNEEGRDCTVVMANDMTIEIGETVVLDAVDGSGLHYPAYYTPISGWMGLQIGSAQSVARIANVATGASGTKATDDLIARGLELFPEDRQPNLIVMNKAALFDLRESRTATSPTGNPAPIPNEVFGIPIITTASCLTSETAVT